MRSLAPDGRPDGTHRGACSDSEKKIRRIVRRLAVVTAVIGILAYGVSAAVGLYGCRLLQTELDGKIRDIGNRWEVSVRVGSVGFHPVHGIGFHDVVIYDHSRGNDLPLLSASRVYVHYGLSLLPRPGVKISGIMLVDAECSLPMPSVTGHWPLADAVKRWQGFSGGGGDSSSAGLGRFVTVGPDLTLSWERGRVVLQRNTVIGRTTAPIVTGSFGKVNYDLRTRQIALNAAARIGETKSEARIEGEGSVRVFKIRLAGREIRLADLSRYLPAWLVAGDDAVLTGSVETVYCPADPVQTVAFNCALKKVGIDHRRLADRPIKNVTFDTSGTIKWDREVRKVELLSSRIGLGALKADVEGSVDYSESPQIKTRLRCAGVPIGDILDSLPPDFIPTVRGAVAEGVIDADVTFAMNRLDKNSIAFDPVVHIRDFRIVSAPKTDITRLRGPFLHRVRKNGKVIKEFWVGPSNPDFVSYKKIGPYAVRAILTCEDGRFFSHRGFQLEHIRRSMEQNIREGRFARGASTISMQTVKNLFLTNEKNISRKFEEMLLTYALEHELGKERILEIYANIIEWGPGIYGIGAASRHYFDKKPNDLTPLEAAYLASIIANPVRYHFMYQRGEVTDAWADYLAVILAKMHLDEKDLAEVKSTKPKFAWVRKRELRQEGTSGRVPSLQGLKASVRLTVSPSGNGFEMNPSSRP